MINYKIPFIVHQTFYTTILPLDIVNIIAHNKKLCPKYKFYFYNDTDCDNFIQKHFEEKVYKAYLTLNKNYGAMRADFFRYCVLYKLGGVYLDIKSKLLRPLGSFIKPDDVCILDIPRNNLEPWRKNIPTYEQWLLFFAPGHPYLKYVIDEMVSKIEKRHQPFLEGYKLNPKQKVLLLTGPDAFTRSINTFINTHKTKYHRNINYLTISKRHDGNYLNMYIKKKHYSEINEPLYI